VRTPAVVLTQTVLVTYARAAVLTSLVAQLCCSSAGVGVCCMLRQLFRSVMELKTPSTVVLQRPVISSCGWCACVNASVGA
jgi:hypothetical protein